jgi:hypothetical protein
VRQLLYISSSTLPGNAADIEGILAQSRHHNAIEGITGLLWSDGKHFLQVLEGTSESVGETFGRILSDHRHSAIVVLHDRQIADREFGSWAMVHRNASDPPDAHDARARRMLKNASEPLRDTFLALVAGGEITR